MLAMLCRVAMQNAYSTNLTMISKELFEFMMYMYISMYSAPRFSLKQKDRG